MKFIPMSYAQNVVLEVFTQLGEDKCENLYKTIQSTCQISNNEVHHIEFDLPTSENINPEILVSGNFFDYEHLLQGNVLKPVWVNKHNVNITFKIRDNKIKFSYRLNKVSNLDVKMYNLLRMCIKSDEFFSDRRLDEINKFLEFISFKSISDTSNYIMGIDIPIKFRKKYKHLNNMMVCLNDFIGYKPYLKMVDVYATYKLTSIEIRVTNKLADLFINKALKNMSYKQKTIYEFTDEEMLVIKEMLPEKLKDISSEEVVEFLNNVYSEHSDPVFKRVECRLKTNPFRIEMTPVK